MKLSLAITTYNRTDMVLEVFEKVYDNPIIDEIVISDDCSKEENTILLKAAIDRFCIGKERKIKFYCNAKNVGMSYNKKLAIERSKNEWVAIIDSDNILYPEYLDAMADLNFYPEHIYCPSFAEPEHDFSKFDNCLFNYENAKQFLVDREFRVFLNTCNYVVNREEYLRIYKYDETIKESDTIYFNTLWLEAGNGFYVVPGMRYAHRKHSGSGWLNGDHRYNMNKAAELQEKIKNL